MEDVKGLVSVIVPCYNQAKFLSESLESVFSQTYSNWECIIVNDGSTDNTEEVALKWVKTDSRFKYINIDHGGPSISRNVALKIAKGEYLQFLDSDDWLSPQKIAVQINILSKANTYSLCLCNYFSSVEDDLFKPHPSRLVSPEFKTTDYLYELISNWETTLSIPIHCILFKGIMYKENCIYFDSDLPNHVDWDFWMKIFALKPEVYYIDQKLVTYRIQSKSLCRNKDLMRKGYLLAFKKQMRRFPKKSRYHKLLKARYNIKKFGVNSTDRIYPLVRYYLKKLVRK